MAQRPPTPAAPRRAARRALIRRRWTRRLLALALGLLLVLPAGELAARLLAPAGNADLLFGSPLSAPEGLYLTDPELIQVPAAGFEGEVVSLDYSVPLRTNALGLRGPALPARSGAPRWLALGDSFTLSVQVREEQTFAARLARRLGVEVWNAGVDGYSTWQATGRYERLAGATEPDGALLLFFTGNDLVDNAEFPRRLQSVAGLRPGAPVAVPTRSAAERWLLGHSFLYGRWRVLRRARAMASGQDPMLPLWRKELLIFHQDGRAALEGSLEHTRAALSGLRDAARAHGDALLVAVAPPAFVVEPERVGPTFSMVGLDPAGAALDAPAQELGRALDALGIQRCDLTEALRRERARGLYFTYDGHWTPEGHELVAEALAACMADRP